MGSKSYAKSKGASDQLREKVVEAGITYDDVIRQGSKHPEIVAEAWPHTPSFMSSIRRFFDGNGMVVRNRDALEKLAAPWFEPPPAPQIEIDDIKAAVREVVQEIFSACRLAFVANDPDPTDTDEEKETDDEPAWRPELSRRSPVDRVIQSLGVRQE